MTTIRATFIGAKHATMCLGTLNMRGIFGRPYVDLEPHLDLGALADVHEEITLALAQLPVDYTGGSHRSMGIVPPSQQAACGVDYAEAIDEMTDAQYATFASLSDDQGQSEATRRPGSAFGEERAHPLSRRQMLWLKYRFGVYFPWKVYVELIPNGYWGDKSTATGKNFTRQARAFFPKTIELVRALPFASVGRCNLMGLEANDHGTVHRDGDPREQLEPDHFIALCPAGNKRLFLWDEKRRRKTIVESRAFWFNDHDHHGVEPAPFFRYSLRVDGVFDGAFLDVLRRRDV